MKKNKLKKMICIKSSLLAIILILVLTLHLISNEIITNIRLDTANEEFLFGILSNLNLVYDIVLYITIGLGILLLVMILLTGFEIIEKGVRK